MRPTRQWWLALGLVTALLVLVGPFDASADTSQAWHMGQHVVLLTVSAPLLALGIAGRGGSRTVIARWERDLLRLPFVRRASRNATALVATAIVLQSAALAVWHLPGPYQAAVRNPLVHGLEHAVFLGTAALFWWAILHTSRARLGFGVLALFVAALPGTALGVLMTFAHTNWYPVYGNGSAGLADQQMAGVVMWAVGNTAYMIAAVILFAAWLSSLEQATPARPSPTTAVEP
ncbi:MAG TPA: cytochrome c oxidase assembly protein [Acidimicrobiia bacterium]